MEDSFACVPGHPWDEHVDGKWAGTLTKEGTGSVAWLWQALLVPEPGKRRPAVRSAHEAGPAFLHAELVPGALGWPGCGH